MESALLDTAVKATVVLALTGTVAAALRSRSAAVRHLVWTTGTTAVVALPALALLLPRWRVAMLPVGSGSALDGALAVNGPATEWSEIAVRLWIAGTLLVLAAVLVGRIRVRRLARDAVPIDHGPCSAMVTRIAGELGIGRRIQLLLARRSVMPMMWGVIRPTILLPREADAWSEALMRDVIMHELAHVGRYDYLSQMIARLACALYWFNPLAWVAARRLRLERERACDDRVIEAGSSPCDYATHLLAVARWRATGFLGAQALGMAGASALSERLRAILEADRSRNRVSRRLAIGHGAVTALLLLPLAAMHPEASPPSAPVQGDPGGILTLPPSMSAPAERDRPAATTAEPAPTAKPARAPESTPKSSPAGTPRTAATLEEGAALEKKATLERARTATSAAISSASSLTFAAPDQPRMVLVTDPHVLSRVNLGVKEQPETCPESKDKEADDIHDIPAGRTKLVSVPRPVRTP